MRMQQVLIERVENPNVNRVTWIDHPERLKPGFWVRLKDDKGWWVVKELYKKTLEKTDVNYGWKVGGL